MFSSSDTWIMLIGVFLGLSFIIGSVYFVSKLFANQTKDVLVRFILLVFAALVGIFIVDKVIAFKINLLSDEMDNQLFELIKTLVLMIFSYYFGTQKSTPNKKKKKKLKEESPN
jgi:hypothetical protein